MAPPGKNPSDAHAEPAGFRKCSRTGQRTFFSWVI